MGVEEFMDDSKPNGNIKRRRDIREYIKNKQKSNRRTGSRSSAVKGVYIRYVPEKVDRWMKENSDQKYIKSRHIADDMDVDRSEVAVALNEMDVELWSSSSTSNASYINPYFSSGQD